MMPAGWKKRLKLTVYKWDVSFSLIFYKLIKHLLNTHILRHICNKIWRAEKVWKNLNAVKEQVGGEKEIIQIEDQTPPPKTINLKAKCEPKRLI